jgi:hypothetical protein
MIHVELIVTVILSGKFGDTIGALLSERNKKAGKLYK